MKDLILKHTLINAVEHQGRADVQSVIGKIIAEDPKSRDKIKELISQIKKTVEEVNSWDSEKQSRELKKFGKIEKGKPKEGLHELPNAKFGKVVMRMAPYPSGPLHIGNSRMVILNDEYVKRYKGKLFLVFDDTIGSEEKFIIPEGYDLILDSLKWLGVKHEKPMYKSDRLFIYYNYAKELLEMGDAYVCFCDAETLRKNRKDGTACEHRDQSVQDNLKFWKSMVDGKYHEGKAVVRLKTDMNNPNFAFRDRVLLRIVERKHPRVGTKYKVWPLLEFSWAIDDHLLGITHILRGKDLVIEDQMEEFIWKKFGWDKAEFVHYGLLSIDEMKLSKTESRKSIESGEYSGWDDPRTWSMQALKRRGIQPEALRKFALNMGLSQADVSIPAEILYAENRKIIDSVANRYFAVLDPVEIKIRNVPEVKQTTALMHPDFPKRGKRKLAVGNKIFVEKNDLENLNGREVRLMDLYNVDLKRAVFVDKELRVELPKIQWVSEPNVKIKIAMPDGTVKSGIAESNVKDLKKDELIQLIRIGFFRVDSVGKETVLYFTHK
ncbi:MAG: glutamate--tRNA ligase [Candidatus Aenigmarchaeota archaeon]|nr:glutamate--tRNA ligase [Candidatus Aenigmarchaeota archaeon]